MTGGGCEAPSSFVFGRQIIKLQKSIFEMVRGAWCAVI